MLFQFSYDILVCLFCSAGAVVELHRRRKVDLLHKRRAFELRAKTQADTIVGKMVSFCHEQLPYVYPEVFAREAGMGGKRKIRLPPFLLKKI